MDKPTPQVTTEVEKARKFLEVYQVSKSWNGIAKWSTTIAALLITCVTLTTPWDKATLYKILCWLIMAAFQWLNSAVLKQKMKLCSVIVELAKG